MIEDIVGNLQNAVAELQKKVAFQEEIISKLLEFVDDKNNQFVTYSDGYSDSDFSQAYFPGDADVYRKEIENKTYRTYDEYYEEEFNK